jgi:prefoldin subunit 5|tara:strand:+ start:2545 stop:2727 length:183 start_codon:yes stop_codon:yes gene_type:complete
MSNHFTLLENEKAVNEAVGVEQIEMINRLIVFVNTRLDEIEILQTDLAKAKTDIETLKLK